MTGFDGPYRCDLCWQQFDTPGELAAHEQEEHDRTFPVDSID